MSKQVTFLTREGCTICREALARVLPAARRLGVEVVETDVDADPDLLARYGDRVPVVLSADGGVLAEGHISRSAAFRAVTRARLAG